LIGRSLLRCGVTSDACTRLAEQAFAVLKRQSQGTNVKLRIIADQVIRSGALDQHGTTRPHRDDGQDGAGPAQHRIQTRMRMTQ
jgi:hypothetical protein